MLSQIKEYFEDRGARLLCILCSLFSNIRVCGMGRACLAVRLYIAPEVLVYLSFSNSISIHHVMRKQLDTATICVPVNRPQYNPVQALEQTYIQYS